LRGQIQGLLHVQPRRAADVLVVELVATHGRQDGRGEVIGIHLFEDLMLAGA